MKGIFCGDGVRGSKDLLDNLVLVVGGEMRANADAVIGSCCRAGDRMETIVRKRRVLWIHLGIGIGIASDIHFLLSDIFLFLD